jgi:hypothetical protein
MRILVPSGGAWNREAHSLAFYVVGLEKWSNAFQPNFFAR